MASAIDAAVNPTTELRLSESSAVDTELASTSKEKSSPGNRCGTDESSALKSPAFQIQAHGATIQGMTVNIQNTYNMMPADIGARKKKRLALKKRSEY